MHNADSDRKQINQGARAGQWPSLGCTKSANKGFVEGLTRSLQRGFELGAGDIQRLPEAVKWSSQPQRCGDCPGSPAFLKTGVQCEHRWGWERSEAQRNQTPRKSSPWSFFRDGDVGQRKVPFCAAALAGQRRGQVQAEAALCFCSIRWTLSSWNCWRLLCKVFPWRGEWGVLREVASVFLSCLLFSTWPCLIERSQSMKI